MSYNLSQRSLDSLKGVDEKLQAVVKRAITLTKQDFVVVQGVRSREQCMENYGKGRTAAQCAVFGIPSSYAKPNEKKVTWLKNPFGSKHVAGKAVDIYPYPIDYNDLSKYKAIATAMKQAAKELGVSIAWGGDWTSSKDYPHFEV